MTGQEDSYQILIYALKRAKGLCRFSLLEVVREWDREVRKAGYMYRFASVDPETWKFDVGTVRVRRHLGNWLGQVLEYLVR